MLAAVGAGCALLAAAGSPAVLAAMLITVGLLLAPTTIVASSLLDTVAPCGTVTEAFSVMIMGDVASTAVGIALGGAIADKVSCAAAALTAGAAAVAGAALVLGRHRTLTPPRPSAPRR